MTYIKFLILPAIFLVLLLGGLAFNQGLFDSHPVNPKSPSEFSSEKSKPSEVLSSDAESFGALRTLSPGEFPKGEFPRVGGGSFEFSELRGKYVLLNLWATWCAPCVAEMPALNTLHEKLSGPNFEVVSISYDEELSSLTRFLEKTPLSFKVLHDSEATSSDYFKSEGFPETFLFGPDGKQLLIYDLDIKEKVPRIVGDRPWSDERWMDSIKRTISGR